MVAPLEAQEVVVHAVPAFTQVHDSMQAPDDPLQVCPSLQPPPLQEASSPGVPLSSSVQATWASGSTITTAPVRTSFVVRFIIPSSLDYLGQCLETRPLQIVVT